VYNGTSPSNKVASLLATYVSDSSVATRESLMAAMAELHLWRHLCLCRGLRLFRFLGARGSSDGIGAGFGGAFTSTARVSFLYFGGDGSTRTSPQAVLQQAKRPVGEMK